MSEKLLESESLTFNLNMLGTMPATDETPDGAGSAGGAANKASGKLAGTENRDEDIFKKLEELGFNKEVIKKLKALGEPFKKAIRVLGFNLTLEKGGNPILAFVNQEYVQKHLLIPGLLNANTFKAIYNAVAKKLVADSEFFSERDYNIIYCKNLYTKSPAEIEKYLRLQSDENLLKTPATIYSAAAQAKNKIVFLYTKEISELNPEKRADEIKADTDDLTNPYADINKVYDATLNSYELAQLIAGKAKRPTTSLSTEKQEELVKKLNHDSERYAAVLALSMTTDSTVAKDALNKFGGIQADKVLGAFRRLITDNIIPKGQLNSTDADALVTKILASRQSQ